MLTSLASMLLLCAPTSAGTQEPDSTAPLPAREFDVEHARHLLARAGFGAMPGEAETIGSAGIEAAITRLVDYETARDDLPEHGIVPTSRPARDTLAELTAEERRSVLNLARRRDRQKLARLRAWWLERMLRSNRPLEEKMTLFWHGHFTSGYREVGSAHLMALQNQLFREHATGNFEELLRAVAEDPAMLTYHGNNRNRRRTPDPRFARALLERYTLGPGVCSQRDIAEAARALTGWSVADSRYVFRARAHDYGQKVFLGRTANLNGGDVLQIALEHEATPRVIARAVLTWFAIAPTEVELEPYARLLRDHSYEIKPLLRTLFRSRWFYSDRVAGKQIKSPVILVTSTLRGLGRADVGGAQLARACASIGQDLMQPPGPAGWPGGTAWITPERLDARRDVMRTLINAAARRNGPGRPGALAQPQLNAGRPTRRAAERARDSSFMLAIIEAAGVREPARIVAELERRFLAVPLDRDRRRSLVAFLRGADGSESLDLSRPRRAEVKLRGALLQLTTSAQFQLT